MNSYFLIGTAAVLLGVSSCASTAWDGDPVRSSAVLAPAPGTLVWVDDPENITLTDGVVRFQQGRSIVALPYAKTAFPQWDASGRILEFVSGSRRIVLTREGVSDLPDRCPGTPSLAPDQGQFAAVSSDGTALEVYALTTGRMVRRLPLLDPRPPGEDYPLVGEQPWWSPRGDRIAYLLRRSLYRTELWVRKTDGSGAVRLNPGLDEGWGAAWSPDGNRLAFYASGGIWVSNVDGTGLVRVTSDDLFAAFPTWSPDGRQIAFQNNSADNGPDVWLVNADGTQPRLLVGGRGFQGHPAWAATAP